MDEAIEKSTMRKVYMRLLPFAILSYFLAYIDRINVSFAGLTMRGDLDMSATAFGLAATSTKLCHIALWNGGVRQRGESRRRWNSARPELRSKALSERLPSQAWVASPAGLSSQGPGRQRSNLA
jgi:hypothetical protein